MIVVRYQSWLVEGLANTLGLACGTWIIGIVSGGIFGGLAVRCPRSIGTALKMLATVASATPVLVTLIFFHYPMQSLLQISIEPFYTALITLALYNTIGVANLFVDGFATFPRTHLEAAKTLGLSSYATLRYITCPLLLRQILPGLLMLQLQIIHLTMFASLISVNELFRQVQRINMKEYDPLSTYTLLAAFYLSISLPVLWLVKRLRYSWQRQSA